MVLLPTIALAAAPAERGPGSEAPEHITTQIGTNRVSITISGGERIVKANGWPDHVPGQFPRRGNPNRISSQNYNFTIPLNPQVAETATPVRHTLFGVAVNGVPFDPATAEFWNNDPSSGWNYEAKSGYLDLGLDEHNAHVQPTGAYHYHALPVGLVKRLGGDETKMVLVGYAADGFPIYTSQGYSEPMNPKSPLKRMRSSYKLKKGQRASGPGGNYDGKFTADYEYVKGAGDLDECNGRFGVTPEYPQGIYHYQLTSEFPYVSRMFRGQPDPSFQRRGPRGPGSRPGPRPTKAGS
jgi:hypothetical protein